MRSLIVAGLVLAGAVTAEAASQRLTWTDNASNETGYRVEIRAGQTGTWGPLISLPTNSTTHTHTGLPEGQEFCYRVFATNAVGDSLPSNVACATTTVTPTVPAAPTGLGVTNL